MSLVSFTKARKDDFDSMKQAIREALGLIEHSFGEEKNVIIKPNLCYYWDYSTGQTTDPRFVAALIDLIREQMPRKIDVCIVESDASAMKCRYAFKMLGYEKLAEDLDVELINLSEDENDVVEVAAGNQTFQLMVPQTIRNAGLRINVPKIKYMSREGVRITCALKNVFGCNPYPKKFRYHSRLAEAIVATNKVMKFDLCLTDGMIVSGIQPCRLGLVMASKDPVAIDVAAAKIAAENPMKIQYIQLAHKEGLGNTSFIERGKPLNYFRDRYPRKDVKTQLLGKAYAVVARAGLSHRLGLE